MITRWPVVKSENFAGVPSALLPSLMTYIVVAVSRTVTIFPSPVFTVTASALMLCRIPITCFLLPCAVTATAIMNSEIITAAIRGFIAPPFISTRFPLIFTILLMVMRRRTPGLRRSALQEFLFLLFFRTIVGPLWIVPLHLHALFHGQLRQVPDESHQFPAIVGASMLVRSAECRHARKSHAIFNNPKKFAVRKFLCVLATQVRRLRIESMPHRIVSAAIISVADGAMVGKVPARFTLYFFRIGHGIRRALRVAWQGKPSRVPRQKHLETRWRR